MDESGFGASNQDGGTDGGGDDWDGGSAVFGGLENGCVGLCFGRGAVPFDFGRRTARGENGRMIYYNQRNYGSMAYPAPGYESATVKTSGCGPVCMSMVIENLGAGSFPPEKSVALALSSGARVSGGTDMTMLLKAVAKKYPITWSETVGFEAALSALRYEKAVVICNTTGDHGTYKGLFSDGGHYVVAAAAGEVYLTILDPYLYPGKFDTAARRGRAVVNGNLVYCTPANLKADCKRYFIVKKKQIATTKGDELEMTKEELMTLSGTGDRPSDWAKEATEYVKAQGIFTGDGAGNYGWQQPISREAVAQIIYNLLKKGE